jgi:hypothetical protein
MKPAIKGVLKERSKQKFDQFKTLIVNTRRTLAYQEVILRIGPLAKLIEAM